MVHAIKQIFSTTNYHKILVVWEVENNIVIEKAKELYNIEIWKMSNIMRELAQKVNTKAYRDNIKNDTTPIKKLAIYFTWYFTPLSFGNDLQS